MVDLDSNPTKLIEIVEIGKQLLMTRGALTTFSMPTMSPRFRHHSRHVCRHLPGVECAQHYAPANSGVGDFFRRDFQRAHHRRT